MWNPFKKQQPKTQQNDNTLVDIMVSLNKDFEISIQLALDDNLKNKNLSQVEYALVCSEFLNIIMSGKIKTQLIDIIMNQIRNHQNKNFIDQILGFLVLMEKESGGKKDNLPIIKPTQVFSKYKNG